MTDLPVLRPARSNLSHGNAYWMARLAEAVYTARAPDDPEPDAENILAALQADDGRFEAIETANADSAQGMLVEHADYLALVFRGTDELVDWLDNFNSFQIERLGGGFHRGFWQSLDAIWQPLYSAYRAARARRTRPLFLAGHSLGGAMALIAASRFAHEDAAFNSVYTFGAPRAMNRETARWFNAEAGGRCYRFQNNNDVVTRVPARLMGYSHAGVFLYITHDCAIVRDPGLWYAFLDYVEGAYEQARRLGIDGIDDHDMAHYLAATQAWDFSD